jgi:hypothetical protein
MEKEYYGCIYKITNMLNEKIYVGQSTRIKDVINRKYKGSGSIIYLAINKYGWNNFKIEILEYCNSIKELNDKEPYWISHYNSVTPNGYNLKKGGEQGGKCSEEAKKNIRQSKIGIKPTENARKNISKGLISSWSANEGRKEALRERNKIYTTKGRKLSEDHKNKISNSIKGENNYFYGKHLKEETKNKISNSLKGRKNPESGKKISDALKGENHFNYGKHLKEETKNKISNSLIGKKISEETRKKMSESRKGKFMNKQHRKNLSNSLKGREFSDTHRQNISRSKRGKKISEETRKKMSESRKGVKYILKLVVCPHCNKKGSGPNMTRYHFDKCIKYVYETQI